MIYTPDPKRYETMTYQKTGKSGLMLPAISLGLWHNFGGVDVLENQRAILRKAFDLGITHFDLANNYGPPPGSAEENFGRIFKSDFCNLRDELIISTKAGWRMWPGPYGDLGSRKYMLASLDQSLKRMGLDYVDIFYSHRPDAGTPLEETMGALAQAVHQGKALYAGISSYSAEDTRNASDILKQMSTPCLIHQPNYNILNRWIEESLLNVLETEGIGCIAFCPLSQGLLTDRYLKGIPEGSRASKPHGFLKKKNVTAERVEQIRKLNEIAKARGQTLAQMSLAWVLKDNRVTSALIGASSVGQVEDNVKALGRRAFSHHELAQIDAIANSVKG